MKTERDPAGIVELQQNGRRKASPQQATRGDRRLQIDEWRAARRGSGRIAECHAGGKVRESDDHRTSQAVDVALGSQLGRVTACCRAEADVREAEADVADRRG